MRKHFSNNATERYLGLKKKIKNGVVGENPERVCMGKGQNRVGVVLLMLIKNTT